MPTSTVGFLTIPAGNDKIPMAHLAFVCARNRARAYSVMIKEFKKSGISQADLASRLGKGRDVISRLLKRPRNLELDTYSEILFAISGAVPKISVSYPLLPSTQHVAEKDDDLQASSLKAHFNQSQADQSPSGKTVERLGKDNVSDWFSRWSHEGSVRQQQSLHRLGELSYNGA